MRRRRGAKSSQKQFRNKSLFDEYFVFKLILVVVRVYRTPLHRPVCSMRMCMSCDSWFLSLSFTSLTQSRSRVPRYENRTYRQQLSSTRAHNGGRNKQTNRRYDFAPAIRKSALFKRPQIKENWSHGRCRRSGACSISSCSDIFSFPFSAHKYTRALKRWRAIAMRCVLCRMCPVASNRIQISHIYCARSEFTASCDSTL